MDFPVEVFISGSDFCIVNGDLYFESNFYHVFDGDLKLKTYAYQSNNYNEGNDNVWSVVDLATIESLQNACQWSLWLLLLSFMTPA